MGRKRKKDRSHRQSRYRANAKRQAQLDRLGYAEEVNGICFEQLTTSAYHYLVERLESYGNMVGEKQCEALYELLGRCTKMAQGLSQGRYAFPLSTGLGKTQSIVAWVSCLHKLGLDHISVAICQSKVEALCTLKRDLMAAGVPSEKIGLLHSYKHDPEKAGERGYASLPSTEDNDTRPYLLCTHNRVMGKGGVEEFNSFNGADRTLVIWDESLMKSEGHSLTALELESAYGWLKPRLARMSGNPYAMEIEHYLKALLDKISAELKRQKGRADTSSSQPISIGLKYDQNRLDKFYSLLGTSVSGAVLRKLLDMSQQGEFRVVYTGQNDGGVIKYDLVVPASLENIIILDASYPIRELMRLDDTIKDVGKASLGVVDYSNVVIHQLRSNSGREAIHKHLNQRREKRLVCKEIVHVVKDEIPLDEGVIFFSFKERSYDGKAFSFEQVLKQDLLAAGVNLDEKLPNGEDRFVWLTWGDETSLSQYSYCSNVILVGVLHRSMVDLSASIVGQCEDLMAEIDNTKLGMVMHGELAHCIYQAISRGKCRTLTGEYANPTKAWLIHPHLSIRNRVSEVMPGVRWKTWNPLYLESQGKIEKGAAKIVAYLSQMDDDVGKVSCTALKRETGLDTYPPQTFIKARDLALSELDQAWEMVGRSVQRAFMPVVV